MPEMPKKRKTNPTKTAAIKAILLTIGIITVIIFFGVVIPAISAILISFLGLVNKQIGGKN